MRFTTFSSTHSTRCALHKKIAFTEIAKNEQFNFRFQIFFRGLGVVFLATSIYAGRCAKALHQPGNALTVPVILCCIETVVLFLLALNFMIGAHMASRGLWPPNLQLAFLTGLSGCSMSTSILAVSSAAFVSPPQGNARIIPGCSLRFARNYVVTFLLPLFLQGVCFADMDDSMKKMKRGAYKSFFKRKKKVLINGAMCCVLLDAVSMFATIMWIPGAEMISGLITTVGQAIVGIYFVRATLAFLRGTIKLTGRAAAKKSGNSTNNKAGGKIISMAKWLFMSGVGMILFVMVMPIAIFSGSVIPGFYDPMGWVCYWSALYTIRWFISFAQIKGLK